MLVFRGFEGELKFTTHTRTQQPLHHGAEERKIKLSKVNHFLFFLSTLMDHKLFAFK